MSDDAKVVLSPGEEQIARELGGHIAQLYSRVGEAEGRIGQIERLISLRLKTKLMAVPGGDNRDAAELLESIREGIEIETVLLDIGERLHRIELGLAVLGQDYEQRVATVEGSDNEAVGAGEPEVGGGAVHSGESESAGEDPSGDADATGTETTPEQ